MVLRCLSWYSTGTGTLSACRVIKIIRCIIDTFFCLLSAIASKERQEGPVWRYLYMWGDDDCPDVDINRILLAFLYAIGWKGGALFPSRAEIDDPPVDGIYKTHMTENELYTALQHLQKDVLKRKDKLVSHAGRKTGYLFGSIRGASVLSLKQDADHESYEVVQRYARDALATMEVNRSFQDPEQSSDLTRQHIAAGTRRLSARACRVENSKSLFRSWLLDSLKNGLVSAHWILCAVCLLIF